MIEVEVWIARDADGSLYLFEKKPHKTTHGYWRDDIDSTFNGACVDYVLESESKRLDNIKWEDKEPCKAKITIRI